MSDVIAEIWREPCGDSAKHKHSEPRPCRACCYVCNNSCGCEHCGCPDPQETP